VNGVTVATRGRAIAGKKKRKLSAVSDDRQNGVFPFGDKNPWRAQRECNTGVYVNQFRPAPRNV
jgi:hypothetical protein